MLLEKLEGKASDLVLLGGLVPELLTRGQTPPATAHLGTTDVDVLLTTSFPLDSEALDGPPAVEQSLLGLGFENVKEGWRWRGLVEGVPVKIEFLCDLAEVQEELAVLPTGCEELRALNKRGTRFVSMDYEVTELTSRLNSAGEHTQSIRIAGLGGYVMAKGFAVRFRSEPKDHYDFIYVLLHNREGGPTGAARRILGGVLADEIGPSRSTLMQVRERFRKVTDVGAVDFATQSLQVEPDADERALRADAAAAADEFFRALSI